MMRMLVMLLPCLLLAETGVEPVVSTGADGTKQVWYRITDAGHVINPEPLASETPPVCHGDTGVLWVDRNHRYGICQSTAISSDGRHILANWYLNAERADYYRTLATEIPFWESPGSFTWAYGGQQIGASSDGSVLCLSSTAQAYKWSRNSPYPDWTYRYQAAGTGYARVSRDGSIVAAACGGTLYAMDAHTGDTLWTEAVSEPARLQGLSLSHDGAVIAVTLYDSCIVYDRGARRAGIPIGVTNTGTQYAVGISAGGERIVTGDYFGRVRLFAWDGANYVQKWSSSVGNPWITAVNISADGSTIACGTGYASGKLCVFDSSSATPIMVYQNYGVTGSQVSSVALSDDGSRVACASWGDVAPSGDFRVFTVHNRNDTTPLVAITRDQEPGSIFACDISADGQFATCGGKAVHANMMGNGGEVYAVIVGATPSVNAGVAAVSSPGRYIQVGVQVDPAGTVRNYGDSTAAVPVHLVIRNSADSVIYHDSMTTAPLPPQSTANVSFASWTAPDFDLYRFQFYTLLPGDEYPGDDSLVVEAKCFHDAKPELINPPGPEMTINAPFSPRMLVRNNGSYPDAMHCVMELADSAGNTVYLDSLESGTINPGDTQTVTFPVWNPAPAGRFTASGIAHSSEDFYPANDTLLRPFAVTYEIMYDDGAWEAFYWVGRLDNDKFYVRFTPTIPAPYSIRHGRIYVNMANTPFDYVMVCPGSGSKPDTLMPLQVVNNVTAPSAPGWADFDLDVTRLDQGDVWVVLHWPSGSPAMGVGADATPPINLRSYFSSNQDTFRLWTTHDWMVRLTQSTEVGIAAGATGDPLSFRLSSARPNPFSDRTLIRYEVPAEARVEIGVYDGCGRLVALPVKGVLKPGRYSLAWNGRDSNGRTLPTGVYFGRLLNAETGQTSVHKLAIVR